MKVSFVDCTLDGDARTLLRRGRPVHLAPKAFELLKVLVENRPRALSKGELLERIWPGVFVSDASLAKVVSKIRDAIGDDESSPVIRTVHGYGYAFVAAVQGEHSETDTARASAACWLFCGNREFPLHDGEHMVGRDPDADICLKSPKVSRRHAKLVVKGTSASIEDLGSKNGSFVGGVRITGPTSLRSGDEAEIGPFKLLFRVAADLGSTLTEAL